MLFTYANIDDYLEIFELLRISFDGNNPSIELFDYLFNIGKCSLCKNENKIIGLVYYVQLSKCKKIELTCAKKFNKDMWYIGYVCVAPEFRNQKIGKKLLGKTIEDIISLNKHLEFIGLNCERKNIIAQNLYKSFDFHMWDFCLINNYRNPTNNENPTDDEMFMYKIISISSVQKFINLFRF